MEISIKIQANVSNISLSQLFLLMNKHYATKPKDGYENVVDFNGVKFKITTLIDSSLNYKVTELKQY